MTYAIGVSGYAGQSLPLFSAHFQHAAVILSVVAPIPVLKSDFANSVKAYENEFKQTARRFEAINKFPTLAAKWKPQIDALLANAKGRVEAKQADRRKAYEEVSRAADFTAFVGVVRLVDDIGTHYGFGDNYAFSPDKREDLAFISAASGAAPDSPDIDIKSDEAEYAIIEDRLLSVVSRVTLNRFFRENGPAIDSEISAITGPTVTPNLQPGDAKDAPSQVAGSGAPVLSAAAAAMAGTSSGVTVKQTPRGGEPRAPAAAAAALAASDGSVAVRSASPAPPPAAAVAVGSSTVPVSATDVKHSRTPGQDPTQRGGPGRSSAAGGGGGGDPPDPDGDDDGDDGDAKMSPRTQAAGPDRESLFLKVTTLNRFMSVATDGIEKRLRRLTGVIENLPNSARRFEATKRLLGVVNSGLGDLTSAADAVAALSIEGREPADTVESRNAVDNQRRVIDHLATSIRGGRSEETADIKAEFTAVGPVAATMARDAALRKATDANALLQKRSLELMQMTRKTAAMRALLNEAVEALAQDRALVDDLLDAPPSLAVDAKGNTQAGAAAAAAAPAPMEDDGDGSQFKKRLAALVNQYRSNSSANAETRRALLKQRAKLISTAVNRLDLAAAASLPSLDDQLKEALAQTQKAISSLAGSVAGLPAADLPVLLGDLAKNIGSIREAASAAGDEKKNKGKRASDLKLLEDETSDILRNDRGAREAMQAQLKSFALLKDAYKAAEEDLRDDLNDKNAEVKRFKDESKRHFALFKQSEQLRARLTQWVAKLNSDLKTAPLPPAPAPTPMSDVQGVSAAAAAAGVSGDAKETPAQARGIDFQAVQHQYEEIEEETRRFARQIQNDLSNDLILSAGAIVASSGDNVKSAMDDAEDKAKDRLLQLKVEKAELQRKLSVSEEARKALESKGKDDAKVIKELKRSEEKFLAVQTQLEILTASVVREHDAAAAYAKLTEDDKTREIEALKGPPGSAAAKAFAAAAASSSEESNRKEPLENLSTLLPGSITMPNLSQARAELKERIVRMTRKLQLAIEPEMKRGAGAFDVKQSSSEVILLRHYREMNALQEKLEQKTEDSLRSLQRQILKPLEAISRFESNVEAAAAFVMTRMRTALFDAVQSAVNRTLGTSFDFKLYQINDRKNAIRRTLFVDRIKKWLELNGKSRLAKRRFEFIREDFATDEGIGSIWDTTVTDIAVNDSNGRDWATTPAMRIANTFVQPNFDEKSLDLERETVAYSESLIEEIASVVRESYSAGALLDDVLSSLDRATNVEGVDFTFGMELSKEAGIFQLQFRPLVPEFKASETKSAPAASAGAAAATAAPPPVVEEAKRRLVVWPRLTSSEFDYIKELRTRMTEAERRAQTAERRLQSRSTDLKIRSTAAKELREDLDKLIGSVATESAAMSDITSVFTIRAYDPFPLKERLFLSWLRGLSKAVRDRRAAGGADKKSATSGGGGGGGKSLSLPDPLLDTVFIRSIDTPEYTPYYELISLFKAIVGQGGTVRLTDVVQETALPVFERENKAPARAALSIAVGRELERSAAQRAVDEAKSAAAGVSSSTFTPLTPAEARQQAKEEEAVRLADENKRVVKQIADGLAKFATFEGALQIMLTSRMWGTLEVGIPRIRDPKARGSEIYQDVPLSAILASRVIRQKLIYFLSASFRQTIRGGPNMHSAKQSAQESDRDSGTVKQATDSLLGDYRRLPTPRYIFEGATPKLTKDIAWQFEYFEHARPTRRR
jgi:hypothetical protein